MKKGRKITCAISRSTQNSLINWKEKDCINGKIGESDSRSQGSNDIVI